VTKSAGSDNPDFISMERSFKTGDFKAENFVCEP
jgi:hypothetical protein